MRMGRTTVKGDDKRALSATMVGEQGKLEPRRRKGRGRTGTRREGRRNSCEQSEVNTTRTDNPEKYGRRTR
jgi:hypothetical protein